MHQPEESIAISLPTRRALRRTLPSRIEPRAIEPIRHTTLTARTSKICSAVDAQARPNVLAFSCEAANAMVRCSQDIARLRRLQRRVSRPWFRANSLKDHTWYFDLTICSRASGVRVALTHQE